jgi:hypothetical protein
MKSFKPQFDFRYFNGLFVLNMNVQMARELVQAIEEDGDNVNLSLTVQLGRHTAEMLEGACHKSDSHVVQLLSDKMHDTFVHLDEKRRAYEEEQ